MIITWSPDTCLCILAFDFRGDQIIYSNSIQKCRLHINFFDQSFLDAVMNHCKSFSAPKTQSDKAKEKQRVRDLGDPVRDV